MAIIVIQVLIYFVSLIFTLTFARPGHSTTGNHFVVPFPTFLVSNYFVEVSTFEEQVSISVILPERVCQYAVQPRRSVSFQLDFRVYMIRHNGSAEAVAVVSNGPIQVHVTISGSFPNAHETTSLLPKWSCYFFFHISTPAGFPFINVLTFNEALTVLTVTFPPSEPNNHFAFDCGANINCESGKTAKVELKPYSIWQITLSGLNYTFQNTRIDSNNKVYVIAGSNRCHNVIDLCISSMKATNTWGKTYVIPNITLYSFNFDFFFRINSEQFPLELQVYENKKEVRNFKVEEANPTIELEDVMDMLVITAETPFALYQEFRKTALPTTPTHPSDPLSHIEYDFDYDYDTTPGASEEKVRGHGIRGSGETKARARTKWQKDDLGTNRRGFHEYDHNGDQYNRNHVSLGTSHRLIRFPSHFSDSIRERTSRDEDIKHTYRDHYPGDEYNLVGGRRLLSLDLKEDSSFTGFIPVEQWVHGMQFSLPLKSFQKGYNLNFHLVSVHVPPTDVKILDLDTPGNWTNVTYIKVGGVMYFSGKAELLDVDSVRLLTSSPTGRILLYVQGVLLRRGALVNTKTFSFEFYQGAIYQEQCKTHDDFGPSDGVDNDCDGLIDEEVENGLDDDNDGRIDEDFVEHDTDGTWSDWKFKCKAMCRDSNMTMRTRSCNFRTGYGRLCQGITIQCNEVACPSYCNAGFRLATDCFCRVCETCKSGYFSCDGCKAGIRPSRHCTSPCPRGWVGVGCMESVPVEKLYVGGDKASSRWETIDIFYIVSVTLITTLIVIMIYRRRKHGDQEHTVRGMEVDWGECLFFGEEHTEEASVTADEVSSVLDTAVGANLSGRRTSGSKQSKDFDEWGFIDD